MTLEKVYGPFVYIHIYIYTILSIAIDICDKVYG